MSLRTSKSTFWTYKYGLLLVSTIKHKQECKYFSTIFLKGPISLFLHYLYVSVPRCTVASMLNPTSQTINERSFKSQKCSTFVNNDFTSLKWNLGFLRYFWLQVLCSVKMNSLFGGVEWITAWLFGRTKHLLPSNFSNISPNCSSLINPNVQDI